MLLGFWILSAFRFLDFLRGACEGLLLPVLRLPVRKEEPVVRPPAVREVGLDRGAEVLAHEDVLGHATHEVHIVGVVLRGAPYAGSVD